MLSFAETKVAIMGTAAVLGVSMDPDSFGGWTLPSFAVALVAYLLWKGERQERKNQEFREDTLKAQINIKNSLDDLRDEIIDRKWGNQPRRRGPRG